MPVHTRCRFAREKWERAPAVTPEFAQRSGKEFVVRETRLPVLVSQDDYIVEHYRRHGSHWLYTTALGHDATSRCHHSNASCRSMRSTTR